MQKLADDSELVLEWYKVLKPEAQKEFEDNYSQDMEHISVILSQMLNTLTGSEVDEDALGNIVRNNSEQAEIARKLFPYYWSIREVS